MDASTPPLSSPYFLTTPNTNAAGVNRCCAASTRRITRSTGFIAHLLPAAHGLPRTARAKPDGSRRGRGVKELGITGRETTADACSGGAGG